MSCGVLGIERGAETDQRRAAIRLEVEGRQRGEGEEADVGDAKQDAPSSAVADWRLGVKYPTNHPDLAILRSRARSETMRRG